ncbi:MAG TPA: class I SAM-dependent methyltransferase [Solirubrobacterales bacterium]
MEDTVIQTGSAGRQGPLWGARAAAWAGNEERQVPTFELGIDRLGLAQGDEVLDIGCGTGVFLGLAGDRGARVHGLDASEALAELARERVPGADVRVGDMESLPFEDDRFDVVTGFNSFFFAADMPAALREAGRVAKPGGAVLIQVWGAPERCDLSALREAVAPLGPPRPAAADAPPLWQPGVLEGMATDAGLAPGQSFDHSYAFEYPDRETLLRLMLSPGVVVAAIDVSGEDRVRDAIAAALEPFRTADGGYRLENEWHYLIATA